MKHLIKITEMINSLNSEKYKRSSIAVLYLWIAISSLFQILVLIFSMVNRTIHPNISMRFFGLHFQEESYNVAVEAIFGIYKYLLFIIPIYVVTVFYVVTCHQIKKKIKNFSETITSPICDYNKMCAVYHSIRATVEYIDHHLSFLVFCSIFYCFTYMYYFISTNLHPKVSYATINNINIILIFSNILSYFFAMTVSASLVGEVSLEVGTTAKGVLMSSHGFSKSLHKFTVGTEKEINLTVWKMVPIRRNFIIGTLAALFTYAVLFDNLNI